MDMYSFIMISVICGIIITLLFVINTCVVLVLGIFLVRHITLIAAEVAELSRTIFHVTDVLDDRANTPRR